MNTRHLMSVKRALRSLFTQNARSRRNRRLPMVQSLECRTLLAAVMESGTTLQIELELSERLLVESNGNSYSFTSTAYTFADAGVTEATDFSGFGTATLEFAD